MTQMSKEIKRESLVQTVNQHFDFCLDQFGSCYAISRSGDQTHALQTTSQKFKQRVRKLIMDTYSHVITESALNDVIATVQSIACMNEQKTEIYSRYAYDDVHKTVLADLMQPNGEVVQIWANGYQVITNSKVKFKAPVGLEPLPLPEHGRIELLREFVSLDEEQWMLLVAWVVSVILAQKPYPILILEGEQGCGKTTLTSFLVALLDPYKGANRSLPKSERELMISLDKHFLSTFDNISGLKPDMSDVFCKVSTGAAFRTRALHTNDEEMIIELARPIIFNGIDSVASRADFADRAITLHLPVLENENRLSHAELMDRFYKQRPKILGGLYAALSHVLGVIGKTKLPFTPRMAQYALVGTCLESYFNWAEGSFLDAYSQHQAHHSAHAIENNPFIGAIVELVKEEPFHGSASELHLRLNDRFGFNSPKIGWPQSPRGVSQMLKREIPHMRRVGMIAEAKHVSTGSDIHIDIGAYKPRAIATSAPDDVTDAKNLQTTIFNDCPF
jgi:putative DNA primase/helicase